MLISYNRPTDIAWSLPTGGTWLTDASVLTNGRPASAARVQWLTGAQTTASVLTLRGTWTTAIVPRLVCLLGLTLPVGTLITLAFRRPADADYTYLAGVASQRVVQLPDGSRCAWFMLDPGLDAVIGVGFRIANDVDGAASISADSTFDVGEAWVGSAADFCLRRSMSDRVIDPTVKRRSYGSQPFAAQRLPYRALQLEFTPVRDEVVHDVRMIRGATIRAEPLAVVPVETDLHDTACFGIADPIDLSAMETGKFWSALLTMQEAPARPVA